MKTNESLAEYRAELARNIEADESGAACYANKALELWRSAELARAELAGIDLAMREHHGVRIEEVRRLVPLRAAAE